jgi:hypothetical protein
VIASSTTSQPPVTSRVVHPECSPSCRPHHSRLHTAATKPIPPVGDTVTCLDNASLSKVAVSKKKRKSLSLQEQLVFTFTCLHLQHHSRKPYSGNGISGAIYDLRPYLPWRIGESSPLTAECTGSLSPGGWGAQAGLIIRPILLCVIPLQRIDQHSAL